MGRHVEEVSEGPRAGILGLTLRMERGTFQDAWTSLISSNVYVLDFTVLAILLFRFSM